MEDRLERDPAYRSDIEKRGRPVRPAYRALTDEELVRTLGGFGIEVGRESFETLARPFLSAEEMTEKFMESHAISDKGLDSDRVWIALMVLWERWLPDRPSIEMLDDRMQEGYGKSEAGDSTGAASIWLELWPEILKLADANGWRTPEELGEGFRGSQHMLDWIQDLEAELWNAGMADSLHHRLGIDFCEEYLKRFGGDSDPVSENMRRAIASFHASLGNPETTDRLYREWLERDPRWGWGWIGWSNEFLEPSSRKEPDRAEEILRQGLAVPEVRDEGDILEHLEALYSDLGREDDAREIRRRVALRKSSSMRVETEISAEGRALQIRERFDFGPEGMPVERLGELLPPSRGSVPATSSKVGRNEPCPCGSGKKHKRCCGRS